MKKGKIIVAVVLTLLVIVSARRFGPNRKYEVEAEGPGFTLIHKAPRGHSGEGPAELQLRVALSGCEASDFRAALEGRVQGTESWQRFEPVKIEPPGEDGALVCIFEVPHHPPTTRYEYQFKGYSAKENLDGSGALVLARDEGRPMMVKFKGDVPGWLLILHIVAMFGGFLILILSALYALELTRNRTQGDKAVPLAWWAWIVMFIGGVPLGIMMNYYAFGVLWEAFPFGGDVTDNKTQVALVIWGIAALGLSFRKGPKSGLLAVVAAVLVLAVFLIPHSV